VEEEMGGNLVVLIGMITMTQVVAATIFPAFQNQYYRLQGKNEVIMISEIEKFNSGWCGIFLRFDSEEIDHLIRMLQLLQVGKLGHFHIENSNDFSGEKGIADIEISLKGKDELDNMRVLGVFCKNPSGDQSK
jgi:hypothetical protein